MSIQSIRRAMKSDQGLSLAELLVAFFVGLLLLTMVGGFFAAVAKGTQSSGLADSNTRQMSTALSTMTQYLHAATTNPVAGQTLPNAAIVSAASTDLTFYAYVNLVSTAAQPVKVRYYIDTDHSLKEQQWSSTCSATTGYCTFSATVTKTIILGGPVASSTYVGSAHTLTPLFQYFNSSGVATSTASSIVYVGINLEWGSTTPGTAGDGQASTRVALLNLGQSGAA